MLRIFTIVIAIAALGGCVSAPRHRTQAYVGGGTLAAIGATVAIAGATTDCPTNVSFHEAADCGLGKSFAPVFGGAMIAAGLVLLGITAWGNPPPPEPE